MRSFLNGFVILFLATTSLNAQELNCQVVVNSDLVNQTNQQVFKTLEQSLREFVNRQSWTNREVYNEEKITCSFVFTFNSYSDDRFEGTLQVQAQRPVYETNYDTPILNFLDKDIVFTYQEFQPLYYNSASYDSNLTSLISFYVYLILGMDADTFDLNGGTAYFTEAQRIVNLAQQSKLPGWNQSDGNRNRFWIIDTLLSNTYREFRQTVYQYHRMGLDNMSSDAQKGKQEIGKAIQQLVPLYERRPNALLLQMFFDSKSQEIYNILSGGPEVEMQKVVSDLQKIAPFFGSVWKKIKT